MVREKENSITLYLTFPKTPEDGNVRKDLLKKLGEWFEKKPLLMKPYKSSKNSISFAAKKSFIGFSFRKPIKALFSVDGANEEVEKFNGAVNTLLEFLNPLFGEIARNVKVTAEIDIPSSDNVILDFTRFLNKPFIERVSKKLCFELKPVALGFDFKFDEHNNTCLALGEGKGDVVYRSTSTLKNNIPINFVQSERDHITKLVAIMKQMGEMDA